MTRETHRFEGRDAKECEEFIYTIKRDAFEKDKDQDDAWLARYASTFMAGDALRWFESLTPETRASWELLRPTLLKEWPSVKMESGETLNASTSGYVLYQLERVPMQKIDASGSCFSVLT